MYVKESLRDLIYHDLEIEKYPVVARVVGKILSPPGRTYTGAQVIKEPLPGHTGTPAVPCRNDAYTVTTCPVDAHVQKSGLAFLFFIPLHFTIWIRRVPCRNRIFYGAFEDYIQASATIRDVVLYDHEALLKRGYPFDAGSDNIYIFWMQLPRFIKKMAKKHPHLRNRLLILNVEQLVVPHHRRHAGLYARSNQPEVLTHSPSNLRFLPPGSIHLPYRRHLEETAKLKSYSAGTFKYDVAIIGEQQRRTNLVRALEARGIKTLYIWDSFGNPRDEAIGKARILLNVRHSGVHTIYPHIRCDRWMFAGKLIVSEDCLDQEKLDVRDNVVFAPYERLVDKVQEVLADFDRFQREYTNNDLDGIARDRDAHWHRFVEQCRRRCRP